MDTTRLAADIKRWGRELGFQAVGIAEADLSAAEPRLAEWLGLGWHGEMDYMARHGALRARPAELVPGTLRVISCRMDYMSAPSDELAALADGGRAYVARYARGRDYHKPIRSRLQKLCDRIEREAGPFGYRVFSDSAPVMEVELATRAGIGWRGKHTLLLSREAGSWFFLGEIYASLALPPDAPASEHCGTCEKCIEVCPTQAIRGPYKLDARRCISYLTIEHRSAIPEVAPAHRQPRLRLRRLPDPLPVELVRAAERGARFRGAQRARCGNARGTLCLERGGVRRSHGGLGDPAHRLRALAEESRRGAGQCAAVAGGARGAARPRRSTFGAGARARAMGIATP
jgi:ferredoxin